MSTPKTVHTIESIYAMTDEVGDCRIWKGYTSSAGVPMVYHDGKMMAVRKVVSSFFQKQGARYYVCKCGTSGCVAYEHIQKRSERQHLAVMRGNSAKSASSHIRRAKISATKLAQGKLNPEAINQILSSNEPRNVLAEKYGVTTTRIAQIRRNGSLLNNVWAGLM